MCSIFSCFFKKVVRSENIEVKAKYYAGILKDVENHIKRIEHPCPFVNCEKAESEVLKWIKYFKQKNDKCSIIPSREITISFESITDFVRRVQSSIIKQKVNRLKIEFCDACNESQGNQMCHIDGCLQEYEDAFERYFICALPVNEELELLVQLVLEHLEIKGDKFAMREAIETSIDKYNTVTKSDMLATSKNNKIVDSIVNFISDYGNRYIKY